LPALVFWVVGGFEPNNALGREAALLETNLVYTLSPISSWLYAALLFAWLWVPAVKLLRKMFAHKNSDKCVKSDFSTETSSMKFTLLSAAFLLGLSVFVGYFPYWHGPEWLVGTDVYWRYKGPLDGMADVSCLAGFEQALKEHQSGFLVLLLGVMKITGVSSYAVLRYAPITLTAMTALATLGLARTLKLGKYGSLLSGIASIMIVPTAIGIFTSILGNWFAVILWVVFLAISLREPFETHVVGATILGSLFSLAILFVHPWSWGPFAVVTGLYLLVQVIYRKLSRRHLAICTSFGLVGLIAGYVSLSALWAYQGWRIISALDHYTAALANPRALLAFDASIEYFTNKWGPFLNPLLAVLAIVGVFVIVNRSGRGGYLVMSWLCVTSMASVLSTALGFEWQGYQWRVFFVSPITILAAFGTSHVCEVLTQKLGDDSRAAVPSTHVYVTAAMVVSTSIATILSIAMSSTFPELGRLLSLMLNLLLVAVLLHSTQRDLSASAILGVTITIMIANSGLRSLIPLLKDPHNL